MGSDDTSISKEKVFKSDVYRCRNCRRKGGDKGDVEIHIHHIVPRDIGGADIQSNAVTLCKACHEAVHMGTSAPTVENKDITDYGDDSANNTKDTVLDKQNELAGSTRLGDFEGRSQKSDDTAIDMLADAVRAVLESTDAPEELELLKDTARERRERSDMLWFELILSMATWGSSSGSDLATNEEYYSQVKYTHLLPMDEDKRIDHLEDVLLDAGVRYQNKKSRYISSHIDRIEEKGGLEIAQEESESQDGKDAKMDFLREFKGIGDKYARNIGMDIFHPDFRDTIALDARINSVSDELGVEFDSYEEHEQFYVDVAERLDMTSWELDRLLYRYTDEVTAHIAE